MKKSANMSEKVPKGKICTLNCPLDELVILKLIIENPNITQKEIANRIGKSERTVKNKVASLKEKGYIRRDKSKPRAIEISPAILEKPQQLLFGSLVFTF